MKKLYLFSFVLSVLILIISCTEEKSVLEVYNADAFAFQLDVEWELNGSAQVKGFQQIEEGAKYTAKLSYYVNLITPGGEQLDEVDYGLIDKESEEEMIDTEIEMQIILDSSFVQGEYILQIVVLDDLSGQSDSTQTSFTLSE